jgi:hypothetical protein
MLYMIGAFLLFVLFLLILIVYVLKRPKNKERTSTPISSTKDTQTIDAFIKVLKTEKKDRSVIEGMVDKVANEFPFPQDEREATKYFEFVYFYAKNPLTTAKMIVYMDKALRLANPKYAKQIEDFQMRGVDARKA